MEDVMTLTDTPDSAAWPSLYEAAKDALQCLRRLPDAEGAYRATCIQQLEHALTISCPKCGAALSTNGFIFWCEKHVFELDRKTGALNIYFGNQDWIRTHLAQPTAADDMGLEFTENEKSVIAEISKKQELRPAKVVKQALATYQLIVMGSHELREVNPELKMPSDEFFEQLRREGR
jgi:hypothetical protein